MITRLKLDGLVNNGASHLQGGGQLFTTGEVFYVSSVIGANENLGSDPKTPKATINGALAACTANKGDTVVVMANHAETVTASSMTLSVAGVTIVNLGSGKADQPTYTFSAATSTFPLP